MPHVVPARQVVDPLFPQRSEQGSVPEISRSHSNSLCRVRADADFGAAHKTKARSQPSRRM